MDAASDLFEQLRHNGLVMVNQIVDQEWQENPFLDFKTLEKDAAPISKQDRRNLAEALSGFANSEGGVILWGVDARASGRAEPDKATGTKPIKNLPLFLTELQRDTAHIVSPAIVGVQHLPISLSTSEHVGFIVTLVPKGQGEPHMARAQDQHRFYYRSGTAFLPMEPFMLADRYGRRPQPKLEVDWRIEDGGRTGRTIFLDIVIGIKNTGLGIALYPAIAIFENSEFLLSEYGLDGNRTTGLPERIRTSSRAQNSRRIFAGGSDFAIQPGTSLDVTCCRREIPLEAGSIPDVTFNYELFCQGFSEAGVSTISIYSNLRKIRGF